MLYNPESLIKQMPPGSMLYARIQDENNQPETAFLIREEPKILNGFGPGPRVEIRVALFSERNVGLISVLAAVGKDALYESWINVHQEGDGMRYLEDLCQQNTIRLVFYGVNGRLRVIGVPNALRSRLNDMLRIIDKMQPWSMAAFDEAREILYKRYPSVHALWNALAAGAQGPKYLSTREVANMMGCSTQYITKLVSQGKLIPALPWTERQTMWFDPAHVEDFMKSRKKR